MKYGTMTDEIEEKVQGYVLRFQEFGKTQTLIEVPREEVGDPSLGVCKVVNRLVDYYSTLYIYF